MAADRDHRLPMLREPIREKIRGVHPALPEQAGRHAAGPAHRPRALPLRAVPGDGRDRRAAGDHAGRSPRHDELLRVLPAGPDRRRPGLGLPVDLVHAPRRRRAARARLQAARRSSPGQTTADGKLTVEFAECLGICDFAPAALADDGRIFGPLDEPKVDAMIEELKQGPEVEPAVRSRVERPDPTRRPTTARSLREL